MPLVHKKDVIMPMLHNHTKILQFDIKLVFVPLSKKIWIQM